MPVGIISRLSNHLMSLYTVLSDSSRGRARTADIVVNSHALYLLSYTGIFPPNQPIVTFINYLST